MAYDVSFIFNAVDNFTRVTQKINSSISNLEKNATKAADKFRVVGQTVRRVGQEMSIFLALPIAFLTKDSVQQYEKAANALSQINLLLKNTKDAAGFTSKQLQQMDENLSKMSLYTKTDIMSGVTKNLLRFKALHGKIFQEAQQATVNISAATGKSLSSVANLMGRLLGGDTTSLMMVSRLVSLTDKQKKMVEQLNKMGRSAEADKFILQKLNIMSGAAATAAKDPANAFKQFSKTLENLSEIVGKIVVDDFAPFLKKLDQLLQKFRTLSPHTQKFLVMFVLGIGVFSVFVAYLGIVITSLSAVIEAFKILTSIEWMALAPMTLLIAGLAFLVYEAYRAYKSGSLLTYILSAIGIGIATLAIATRLALGPLGIIITIIELVGMGFAYAYKHSATFREEIQLLIGKIEELGHVLEKVWGKLKEFGGTIKKHFSFLSGGKSTFSSHVTQSQAIVPNEQQKSRVDINLHVNDKNNLIKNIESKKTGDVNFNLGRNMAMAG